MKHHLNKTRIAPTPSGFLHAGNIFSFKLTQQLARETGAKILLRIDDLDSPRVRDGYLQNIFDTLKQNGIEWDEGPRDVEDFKANWSQSHRKKLYDELIEKLWNGGHLFACTCSRESLKTQPCECDSKRLEPFTTDSALRMRTAEAGGIIFQDIKAGQQKMQFPDEIKNFIVRKKDGNPAYQTASVADDVHFGCDLIIRGKDLLPSTLAQLFLAEKAGVTSFLDAQFLHHDLVKGSNGLKLSKTGRDRV